MSADTDIFEFERDFAQSLRCIPMSVRRKLDCSGVKVSLRQWSCLMEAERAGLLQLRCDDPVSCEDYRRRVVHLVQARSGQVPAPLPVLEHPEWQRDAIPEQLGDFMRSLQLPPLSAVQWGELDELQRFALLKLSRPGHENENFLPAMREFGLLSD